ncbi:MAG: hypothetical protein AAF483_19890, partial [Planctomycetota bacterium]
MWHHESPFPFQRIALSHFAFVIALLAFSGALALAQSDGDLNQKFFRRVVTIAGNGESEKPREKGPALEVPLSNPFGVQPEADGSLII